MNQRKLFIDAFQVKDELEMAVAPPMEHIKQTS
jgi:hypothetical protein